jgi:hypothetical protein
MKWFVTVTLLVALFAGYAQAAKPCEELKEEIAKKIEANGVKLYSLEIVSTEKVKEGGGKVVGSCDGGTKKIVYNRDAAKAEKPVATSKTAEPSKQ